jgi:hypothetical protein
MNQVDAVVLACLLFGGFVGAVKGPMRAFAGFSGTVLGFALAGLYASRLVPVFGRLFQTVRGYVSLQVPWVATVSTQATWSQSAYGWLGELAWPESLKDWIAAAWGKLPPGETMAAWAQVVENGFFFALANICAFVTILLLTRVMVSLLYNSYWRLTGVNQAGLSPVGFLVGLLQSFMLVLLVLAVLVPFFLWVGQAQIAPLLQSSVTLRAVFWLWNSILVI